MNIGFYVLGKKGFAALTEFVKIYGGSSVAFVLGAGDDQVEHDWFDEIAELCKTHAIRHYRRGEQDASSLPAADCCFAIGWRWMIHDAISLVVFHDSLLPRYRGFSPLVNMMIDGAEEIGVTALLGSGDYDKGDVVYQTSKRITYPIKIARAIDEVIPLYADLVVRTAADILATGVLAAVPQDEGLASYGLWRDDTDYLIDWSRSAAEIRRFVDAVGSPYRGATSVLNGKLVRILDVELAQDVIVENRKTSIGKIVFLQDGCPIVVCGQGLLKIVALHSADGRSLAGRVPFRSRFESRK